MVNCQPVRRPAATSARSRFRRHVCFSFGPAEASLDAGLERLGAMIGAAR